MADRSAPQRIILRQATPADVDVIAALHLASWRATYDPLLGPADRARLNGPERRAAWARRLAEVDAPVWLAEAGGGAVGFVAVGPARDADLDPREVGEVTSLHVAADLQGRGLGRQLLTWGEASLRAAGLREAVLWVLTENARARRFYERAGWRLDGASVHHAMGGEPGLPVVDEVRYRRSL